MQVVDLCKFCLTFKAYKSSSIQYFNCIISIQVFISLFSKAFCQDQYLCAHPKSLYHPRTLKQSVSPVNQRAPAPPSL
ncbi:hypothetical protein FRX31_031104 [Thalictrum thalictroides]|uniref:Uncharacterized protein n=1 Tax=Thalictrum thalictroides TaxID=46969 RepID=A0A7J6V4I4_THATH|nr:hypothetical protein FRX31_031104 [Thalictrum thalictroides]